MATLKGLIFDLDGTIIDNMEFHMKAWHRFFVDHHLDPNGYQSQIHGTNQEILPRIFGKPLTPDEISRFAHEKESIYRKLYQPYITPFQG